MVDTLVEQVRMMKVLPGRLADSFEEAITLAFQEAGKGGLSPDIAAVFTYTIDNEKVSAKAERFINTTDAAPDGMAGHG